MTARSFQVRFSASARSGALDQMHHLAKSVSRTEALAKMTSVVDEVATELRKSPIAL